MATEPYEVIVGPGQVWIAPVGTTFPTINQAPATEWISLGRTDGGVTIRHIEETEEITVDQSFLPVKEVVTRRAEEIEFALAEITLERYAKLLGDVTVTTQAAGSGTPGYKSLPIQASQNMARYAMLIRVPSPYMDAYMQYEYAAVSPTGQKEIAYQKGEKSTLSTTWKALEDPSNPGVFGTLRAQHQPPA